MPPDASDGAACDEPDREHSAPDRAPLPNVVVLKAAH